jgi:cytochrome c oxidase assembly protein subunit 15
MNAGLYRFSVLTVACTVLLLAVGALVTSTDAGDSVPDWPLAYGALVPPLVGNIVYEYGHRVMGALVGFLTIILALWNWRADERSWMRRLGWFALGAVVVQGLLGGVRVLNPQFSGEIALVHTSLAQIFLCIVVSLAVFSSRSWKQELPELDDFGGARLRTLSALTFAAVFLQLLLGAAFRHRLFGTEKVMAAIAPHFFNAFWVLAMTVIVSHTVRKRFVGIAPLRRAAATLSALVGTQILLGLIAYLTVAAARTAPQPPTPMVWATVAHVVLGALTLANAVVLGLFAFRVTRSEAAAAASREHRAVA